MKNKLTFLFLFLSLGLFLSSCGDDEAETCDVLSETLIGTWESASLGAGEMEFQTDGTLVDADDLLISGDINGTVLTDKNWSVNGNSELTVRASEGSQFLEAVLNVPSFDCDIISLEQFGIMVDLIRK